MSHSHHTLLRPWTRHFGIALLVMANLASARDQEPVAQEAVKHSDLELSSAAGIEALYQRIQAVAKRVCKAGDPIMRLYTQVERARTECHRKTVHEAVVRADRPALTAWHQEAMSGTPK